MVVLEEEVVSPEPEVQEIHRMLHLLVVMALQQFLIKVITAGLVIMALLTIVVGAAEQVRLVVVALGAVQQGLEVQEQHLQSQALL
jgi:hypothetical protein